MGIAFGWYTADTYPRLREISADKDRLPETFQEWEKRAQAQVDTLKQRGIDIQKTMINPDALFTWASGSPIDSKKRAEFAAMIVMQKYEAGSTH